MKVIINFGEKKVVVPCGAHGDLTIGDLIRVATNKYCKLVRKENFHLQKKRSRLFFF